MPQADSFNANILASVARIDQEWAGKGYDINSYFTHDLTYGPDCCIKANHPPLTMCVAAMVEVIVGALNAWYIETGDHKPFEKLPIRSWRGGSKRDIRAHIFMYGGLASNGTAHALERFGIGRVTSFAQLQPGDFVNFNRAHSGHACVFLSYIDAAGKDLAAFGPNVAGWRYFSSQGSGAGSGFGYRWGFFEGQCPASLPAGQKRDCGIIRSDKPNLLCCGTMLHPAHWPEQTQIERAVVEAVGPMGTAEGPLDAAAIEAEMARELPAPDLSRFTGETTD